MFKSALGPSSTLSELARLNSAATQLAALRKAGAFSGIVETVREQDAQRKRIFSMMTPSWATALRTTALAVSQLDNGVLEQQRALARSFDSGILKTLENVRLHQTALATAMSASQWQDQFKLLADRIAPSFDVLRQAAERMRMIDMLTLRATAEHLQASGALVAAQQVAEAHRLFEAMGQAQTPDDSARLLAALLATLATVFTHFKGNTVEELRKLGLFGLIGLYSALLAFFPVDPAPDLSPAERQAFVEMRAEIDSLQRKLDTIRDAESSLNEAFVSSLPRAELSRDANIRREPRRGGDLLLRAPKGTLVAVMRSVGRWRLVVYRDPLTDQLSQGWVYAPAVLLLSVESH